jgi:hypothetical protein
MDLHDVYEAAHSVKKVEPAMTDRTKAALIDLAQWIEHRFALSSRTPYHRRTDAEHIYNEIVRRIGEDNGEEERTAKPEGA